MRTSCASMLVLATVLLVACNRPSETASPSVTPEAVKAATNTVEPPPLAVKTDVNSAEAEEFRKAHPAATPAQPPKDGADQGLHVAAQEAAALAPDTASGDEAKNRVLDGGASGKPASAPSNPQAAELPKSEEMSAMPKPGQANDHSSDGPAKAGEAEPPK